MTRHLDTRACGIPVTIEYSIQGPDPEVGLNNPWIDEWYITHINGRKVKGRGADWLYTKIDKTPGENDRIQQSIWDSEDDRY